MRLPTLFRRLSQQSLSVLTLMMVLLPITYGMVVYENTQVSSIKRDRVAKTITITWSKSTGVLAHYLSLEDSNSNAICITDTADKNLGTYQGKDPGCLQTLITPKDLGGNQMQYTLAGLVDLSFRYKLTYTRRTPPPKIDFATSKVDGNSIILNWPIIQATPVGYRLGVATDSGTPVCITETGAGTANVGGGNCPAITITPSIVNKSASYRISNLASGASYRFTMTTFDGDGESAPLVKTVSLGGLISWGTFVNWIAGQVKYNATPVTNSNPETKANGTYVITAPEPGIFTSFIQSSTGAFNGQGTIRYDPLPPECTTCEDRVLTVSGIYPLVLAFDEKGLSGVQAVDIQVKDPAYQSANYAFSGGQIQNDTLTLIYDFKSVGRYLFFYRSIDNAGNKSDWKTFTANVTELKKTTDPAVPGGSGGGGGLTPTAPSTGSSLIPAECGNGFVEASEQCDDGNTVNGDSCSSTCTTELAGIQIIGLSHTEMNLDKKVKSVGDSTRAELKNMIQKNITMFLKSIANDTLACKNNLTITNSTDWKALPCAFQQGGIVYVREGTVTFADPNGTITLPAGIRTMLIEGGNVYLKSNLVYPKSIKNALGIIAVKSISSAADVFSGGGNVYVTPNVTNIQAFLYSDGAVASINTGNQVSEWRGTGICPADGSGGFCNRTSELKNQLYWEGTVSSANTIGGADTALPELPPELRSAYSKLLNDDAAAYRTLAKIFDLNYFRTFRPGNGGIRAGYNADGSRNTLLSEPPGGTANNYTMIIKHDSRISTNPPPLFSGSSKFNGGESGR